jgi:hypothetical protein
MPGNQGAHRANKRESSLSAASLRPCEPLALIPVNGHKNEIGGKIRTAKWLQCATLESPGGDLREWKLPFSSLFRPLRKCFTWFGCLLSKIVFFWIWPLKDAKTKRTFHGFPGTFARLKSRLRQMPGNQVRYGPNGPGNQAPGRSSTMLTRTVSRGRYSIKFRSTCRKV